MVPTEGRAKQRDISNIHNLIKTPDKFEFLYSTKDNILSAEKQLEILNTKLHTEERLIVFIDSISSFMEEARQVEYGKATRGGLGQVLKTFCDSNTHVVPLREHIIVGVTHTVANTGNGMATKYEKMPSAFGYQHDVKLKWIWDKQEEWMCGDEQIGIRPKWKVETHAGRGAPNREFSSRFLFNYGISHEAEVMDYAIELSIIKKAGAWMKYVGDDGEILLQAQGWEGFFEALCKEENRSIYEQIYAKVKEEL